MSTSYFGVPGNIASVNSFFTTIPQDAVDSLNVASFNVALQKLTDSISFLGTKLGPMFLSFGGTPGNTASTNYFLLASSASVATAAPTTSGLASDIATPVTVVVRGLVIQTTTTTVGGTVTVSLVTTAGVQATVQIVLGAGTVGGPYAAVVATPFTTTNGSADILSVRVANGAGVTTSTGGTIATLLCTLA